MKNSFSNALLCGVLASSFLIVNCQKAPSRGVQAKVNPAAKQQSAPKIATCTQDALDAIAQRKTVADEMKALINKNQTAPLEQADKDRLQQLTSDLLTATTEATDKIKALKVGEADAEGCDVADPSDASKKSAPNLIADMLAENASLASRAKAITGLPNEIDTQANAASGDDSAASGDGSVSTQGSGDASTAGTASGDASTAGASSADASSATAAPTKILEQQTLIINSSLGEALDSSKVNGEVYMVEGEILTGRTNFEDALVANEASICYVSTSAGKLAERSQLKVMEIKSQADTAANSHRQLVGVSLVATSNAYALSCSVPEGRNVNTELRTVLGDLITVAPTAAASSSN